MPTSRIVRSSHSHSSLSKRRPFQLRTSKSFVVNTAGRVINDVDTTTSPLPKKIISKELISLDTILKRKPSLIVRRMLSLDGDTPQADTENVAIESESDDDATLVAGLHPPFVKKLEHYEAFTTKEIDVEPLPPVMLGKKIRLYLPGFSDDEDDSTQESSSSHDEAASKAPRRNEILDAPGFEILKEDGRIVYDTVLSPPPWHRPKENVLVYEPAGPHEEVPCPWSGEPVRDFAW